MQRDDNNSKRKVPTSVEIVHVSPPTDNETPSKAEDVSAGTRPLVVSFLPTL